jgi:hypothetical protein
MTGIGVLIQMLGGNDIKAIKNSIGKAISNVSLEKETNQLLFEFIDGKNLVVWDDGQRCCELRYMTSDDDLSYYSGATLMDIEVRNSPNVQTPYGTEHEVQFLVITTSKGQFTIENHNEHNGYYGGFWLNARELPNIK